MERRIQVFRAGLMKRKWAFRFIAGNNQKIAQSETYSRRSSAEASAHAVANQYVGIPIEIVE